ncbi:hypothetical protein CYMTET_26405 [Cymbomonas tetramitiformis]|uniref:Uncharacterized protein n=1 Tax=Cymbomonas tetramitiformis TaxID=36881 RepID=A0AAE0FRX5_9CHLO|nr:hypothetical protein CYMTET_26405 [Cymbomonas tetramitiformis]
MRPIGNGPLFSVDTAAAGRCRYPGRFVSATSASAESDNAIIIKLVAILDHYTERLESFVKASRSGGAQVLPPKRNRKGLADYRLMGTPATLPVSFDKAAVEHCGPPAVITSGGDDGGVDLFAYGFAMGDACDDGDDVLDELGGLMAQVKALGADRVASLVLCYSSAFV